MATRRAPWKKPNPRKAKGRAPRRLTAEQKSRARARAAKAGRRYPNLVDNMAVSGEARTKAAAGKKATARKKKAPTARKKKAPTRKKAPARKAPTARKAKAPARKAPTARKTKSPARKAPTATQKKAPTARKTQSAARKTTRASKAPRTRKAAPTRDPRGGLTAAGRLEFLQRDGSHLLPGVKKREADMTTAEKRRKGSWAVRFYGRTPLPKLVDAKGRPTRFALSAHAWGEPVPKTPAAARRIAAKGHRLLARAKAEKAKRT